MQGNLVMKFIYLVLIPLIALGTGLAMWWKQQTPQTNVHILPLAEQCQLHQQACTIHAQGLTVTLDVAPKPIPIAKQLSIKANITGAMPSKVQLDINGSNMYMGYNRIPLVQQEDGSWAGKSLLAFCTIDKMQWQLTLIIDLNDGTQIQAPFPLTTPYVNKGE
jgi:hypothetical protein